MLNIILYADSLGVETFTKQVGKHLFRANLSNAYLEDANLEDANLNNSILLKTDFRHARNLTSSQLSSEDSPPLLCGALLPEGLGLDPDRDWDRLALVLHERYPEDFNTLEEAEKWVEERRPK
ncbi:pentapeptide repeat-containing protein [[Leptolyngbya] sp. PCC 7376]|uniref:pentapeptide repeat-containing protein n=1 Tax=[Leptolyngbya] sp. PCC 7376 TaxID=111781 RepID=UPI000318E40D|nr:pentapeptide repeat-containing protein [[Leptolyngbya] sp. PCC 7376]